MDAQILNVLLILVVIIFSTIIHEVMHGLVADKLGDPTARYAGRLTLNPLKHLDPLGSFVIPILTYLSLGTAFGYAKPVPINPYNLKGHFGEALVAAAGPASNIAIALLAGLTLRFVAVSQGMADVLFTFTYINVLLCLFNLIPIPPLDGSRVLAAILPRPLSVGYDRLRGEMERNPLIGMGIVLVVVMFFGGAFGNLIFALASVIAGQ
jgi:Zn-dependent protease